MLSKRSPASNDFESEPVRFRSADCGDKNRMDRACCRALADLFCELMPFVILLVFLLVSAAIVD